MADLLIAYCGLKCAECEAYQVTRAQDLAAQQRLVEKWRVEYNSPEMTLESVICDGCSVGERHGGYCAACPVRACAVQRRVTTCAACAEYPCEELEKFFVMAPSARVTLDEVRAGL